MTEVGMKNKISLLDGMILVSGCDDDMKMLNDGEIREFEGLILLIPERFQMNVNIPHIRTLLLVLCREDKSIIFI